MDRSMCLLPIRLADVFAGCTSLLAMCYSESARGIRASVEHCLHAIRLMSDYEVTLVNDNSMQP